MIDENSLYANLYVETSPVQTTAAWTNHIATVSDVSLTRGGQEPYAGINDVEAGSGTITLIDNAATINPGYWVRVRYNSTIIWAGYVQDVLKSYANVNGDFYETKTLVVLDWVAWISQFTVSGLIPYGSWQTRNYQINQQIPSSPLTPSSASVTLPNTYDYLNDAMSVAEALNLTGNTTANGWWRSELVVPTGSASINNIVKTGNTITAQNVALTDGTHTGSPTNLTYYTDIQVGTQTSQVFNSVRINNVFGIGGETFVTAYEKSDATSIATYGGRFAECDANSYLAITALNLVENPSFENSTVTWSSTNWLVSVEQPSRDSTGGWAAKNGTWAIRGLNLTGSGTLIQATDELRIPVDSSTTYYFVGYGAISIASTTTRARAQIVWYNDAGTVLSTSYGSYTTVSAIKTWLKHTVSATSPATAVYARVGIATEKTGGGSFAINQKVWGDLYYLGTQNASDSFDGNFADDATNLYGWLGQPNASKSFVAPNSIDTLATQFLTDNSVAKYSPIEIRVNAQANLTAVQLFNLNESIYVWFKNNRWTSVVTGIQHNITINPDGTTRWMIDLIVRPSTATI